MKIGKLIELLMKKKKTYGDIPIFVSGYYGTYDVEGVKISTQKEYRISQENTTIGVIEPEINP